MLCSIVFSVAVLRQNSSPTLTLRQFTLRWNERRESEVLCRKKVLKLYANYTLQA